METILFIVFWAAVALSFVILVAETRKQYKRFRAQENHLIQVALDTDHLSREENALKAEVAQLAKQVQALKKPSANPHLVVIETEVALPKYAKTTTEQQPTQPSESADKPKEQPAENKFTAAYAASHRKQYLAYRKQGLGIREAGAKAGVSRTTACRYEQWAKRQK